MRDTCNRINLIVLKTDSRMGPIKLALLSCVDNGMCVSSVQKALSLFKMLLLDITDTNVWNDLRMMGKWDRQKMNKV